MSPYHVPRSDVQRWKLSLSMYVHSNAHTNIKYMSSIYSHGKHQLKDHTFLENTFVLHCIHHSFFPDISSWAPSPSTAHKAKEPSYIQRKLKARPGPLFSQHSCGKLRLFAPNDQYIFIYNGNPWEMINNGNLNPKKSCTFNTHIFCVALLCCRVTALAMNLDLSYYSLTLLGVFAGISSGLLVKLYKVWSDWVWGKGHVQR